MKKKEKKILDLLQKNEFLKEKIDFLESKIEHLKTISNRIGVELAESIHNSQFSPKIQRAIIGKKGSGKTTLIQNLFLTKNSNFFVIDFTDEYNTLSDENRLYIQNNGFTPDSQKDLIMSKIKENKDKLIIIDGLDSFIKLDWFFRFISDFNFIYTSCNRRKIDPYQNQIDLIYYLGTSDEFQINSELNRICFVNKISDNMIPPIEIHQPLQIIDFHKFRFYYIL